MTEATTKKSELETLVGEVFKNASRNVQKSIINGLEKLGVVQGTDLLSIKASDGQAVIHSAFAEESRAKYGNVTDADVKKLEPFAKIYEINDVKTANRVQLAKLLHESAGNHDLFDLMNEVVKE